MEEYKRLNPKSKLSMFIGNAIMAVVIAVIIIVALTFANDMIQDNDLIDPFWIYVMIVTVFTLMVIYFIAGPLVFYSRYRYMINDERIDIRRGILIIRRTMVPTERIHQVEVMRGPINNMLGLANVVVTTAGGIAVLEYLEINVAEEIAENLNVLVNRIVKVLKDERE